VLTYGTTRQAEVRAINIRRDGLKTHFDVQFRGDALWTVTLNVPGMHNVRNALAAVAVGVELDVPFDHIRDGLAAYDGVRRRFQQIGDVAGRVVLDDYAHHPTEIEATLDAASQGFSDRRIVAVFQPHLYSRTRDFQDGFARAFFNADVLVVTDVYKAREAPIEGVSGEEIARRAQNYGHRSVHYVPEKEQLPEELAEITAEGDVVLMMGAGDIWRYSRDFVDRLTDLEPALSNSDASA